MCDNWSMGESENAKNAKNAINAKNVLSHFSQKTHYKMIYAKNRNYD